MAGNNNVHRGPARDKPWRDALRMVMFENDRKKLIAVARTLAAVAEAGDVAAAREIGDRLDGKVPQAIGGDDEIGPIDMIVQWAKAGG